MTKFLFRRVRDRQEVAGVCFSASSTCLATRSRDDPRSPCLIIVQAFESHAHYGQSASLRLFKLTPSATAFSNQFCFFGLWQRCSPWSVMTGRPSGTRRFNERAKREASLFRVLAWTVHTRPVVAQLQWIEAIKTQAFGQRTFALAFFVLPASSPSVKCVWR